MSSILAQPITRPLCSRQPIRREYETEFGSGKLSSATVTTTPFDVGQQSTQDVLNLPGPLYKWVRINAVSEVSMGIQVAPYDVTVRIRPSRFSTTARSERL